MQNEQEAPDVKFLGRRVIKHVRKPYTCRYCGKTFPVGASCYMHAFKEEGVFGYMRTCSPGAECINDHH